MQRPHLRGDSAIALSFDIPLRQNGSPSTPVFFRSPSLVPGDHHLGFFPAALTPDLGSRWKTSPTAGSPIGHEGLSPLLIPAYNAIQYEDARRGVYPPFVPRPSASPRQRSGFPRSAPILVDVDSSSSPRVSDGFPSPSLPVLSPQASARKQIPSPRHKSKGFARLSTSGRHSQALWLLLYFAFNLGLTLYNKLVLVRFPFPYTLTALHALCGSIGGLVLQRRGVYVPARLRPRDHLVLVAFSILYAINIAVSNVSLQLVTVPFHQVVRAATPIFTTLLSMFLFGTHYSGTKLATLVPVMAGVALATYGDYYFTWGGLFLTLVGTFLAALKTIYTNVLQSSTPLTTSVPVKTPLSQVLNLDPTLLLPPRLHLHPLDLLTRMSPLAFVQCILYAYFSGELAQVRQSGVGGAEGWIGGWGRACVLLGNGAIAFGLNVVSLSANKRVGALNMTVAANVKQVLTVLCAVSLFDLTITGTNAAGIAVTLAGGAWYAWIERADKARPRRFAPVRSNS